MVFRPTADEEAVGAVLQRVKDFVAEKGGTFLHEERWGMRRLAYPIAKFREGNYVLTRFQLDGSHTKELDDAIKLQEEVIRHLLVKVEE